MSAEPKSIHADWLRTFRALEAYTKGFTEPMQGKTGDWFLAGPLVSHTWVKNIDRAKVLIPRKHHAKVIPGILYATAFSGYQMGLLDEIKPDLDACWNMAVGIEHELKNLQK